MATSRRRLSRRIVDAIRRFRRPLPRRRGRNVEIHHSADFAFPDRITIGNHVYIGPHCFFNGEAGLTIGDGSIFAPHVVILTTNHNYNQSQLLPYGPENLLRPTSIGRGTWIGYRAMLVPGVQLGDGVVVGMGSVVTKSFEDGSIIAGNPAKLIKQRPLADVERLVSGEHYYLKWKYAERPLP